MAQLAKSGIRAFSSNVSHSGQKFRVGVLGATGVVGQRFIELLEGHPYFEVVAVGASERSAGKTYTDATLWRGNRRIPQGVANLEVVPSDSKHFVGNVDVVFSGLDSGIAFDIEKDFAAKDIPVFSNTKSHRRNPNVPCISVMCNSRHIPLMIPKQREVFGCEKGFIVTNPNCTTTGLVNVLEPLRRKFGLDKVICQSMQAISGAGYPGVPSMDIVDNVVPYIGGEEEKLEWESNKLLGDVNEDGTHKLNDVKVSAHCNRVGVTDGHTVTASIKFKNSPRSIDEVREILAEYVPDVYACKDKMPSLPPSALRIRDEDARPQPRFDRMEGGGYTTSVGRIRECNIFDVKLHLVSHNTIIGAAGGSILNAEYCYAIDLIHRQDQVQQKTYA